jgi:hypothetical protein
VPTEGICIIFRPTLTWLAKEQMPLGESFRRASRRMNLDKGVRYRAETRRSVGTVPLCVSHVLYTQHGLPSLFESTYSFSFRSPSSEDSLQPSTLRPLTVRVLTIADQGWMSFGLSLTESTLPISSASKLCVTFWCRDNRNALIRYFQPCTTPSLQGVWVWREGALV